MYVCMYVCGILDFVEIEDFAVKSVVVMSKIHAFLQSTIIF